MICATNSHYSARRSQTWSRNLTRCFSQCSQTVITTAYQNKSRHTPSSCLLASKSCCYLRPYHLFCNAFWLGCPSVAVASREQRAAQPQTIKFYSSTRSIPACIVKLTQRNVLPNIRAKARTAVEFCVLALRAFSWVTLVFHFNIAAFIYRLS